MINLGLFGKTFAPISIHGIQNNFVFKLQNKLLRNTPKTCFYKPLNTRDNVKYRYFTTSSDNAEDESDVEFELRSYCQKLKQFVVFNRLNEANNLNSFLTRMTSDNIEEYLKGYNAPNYNNLRNLENYMNILYTFSCCGFYINPDDLKRVLDGLFNEYMGLLGGLKNSHHHSDYTTKSNNTLTTDEADMIDSSAKNIHDPSAGNEKKSLNLDRVERLGRTLALAILSSCELGVFKDNLKQASDIIETSLIGELFNVFLEKSSGKLINSILFLFSTVQFFEKDYDSEIELKYDSILRSISEKETSLELSDLYYLRISHVFTCLRIPGLNKKLSKESLSFLSNVVFQDYIREKDIHGLEDIIPSKVKQIDSNIEGGLFNIGLYTFTHVSLPNKNVYLLNSPKYYFNSNLSFGKREYIKWMDSFIKTSGWNLIYV